MTLGIVGLGRMGAGLAARLMKAGHPVVGLDLDPANLDAHRAAGGQTASTVPELVAALDRAGGPRVVWLMVPAGKPVDGVLSDMDPHLRAGDVVVDGGNSNYEDSMRRAAALAPGGVHFVDCGTSGGVWGEANGFCLMVGGTPEAIAVLAPAFDALTAEGGWAHVGPSGAGHYVKMIHNGIEYGLMQAYAEGFALLRAKEPFGLDLAQVTDVWRHGSVVRSWLLDLAARAFEDDPHLDALEPVVADSGMGRWTATEAIRLGVAAPVLTLALHTRFASRDADGFGNKLLAALRQQFGGHAVVATPAPNPPTPTPREGTPDA